MRKRQNRQRKGFTLLELMLVLAILVVLGGVVIVNIGGAQDDAYQRTTQVTLDNLKTSIRMYRVKVNQMPESLDELVNGPSDPDKKALFGSPVIEEVPKDGWGNELTYTLSGNEFEIRSAGKDGQVNTDDDIVENG
ncbi:type II secretion system protein GspG [Candidatus Laterigemmans baculatus]|uniref:type II secretion system protein GspG n=1 Tax=Candidatus Laterigemmans baculatus TaxID=2770505 RepID=UPI0013D9FF89|nr:type II secretion system protein GspG [Candidatus Laterigemmans baculatus]